MRIVRGTARIAIVGNRYTLKLANVHLQEGLARLVGSVKFEAKAAVCLIPDSYIFGALEKRSLMGRGAFRAIINYFTRPEGRHNFRYYF